MKIQDIYTIGTRMHGKLLAKKIHTLGMRPEEFKRIWEETRNEIASEVEDKKIDLLEDCFGEIDWNLHLET